MDGLCYFYKNININVSMKNYFFYLIISICLFCSCQESSVKADGGEVLTVDLDKKVDPFDEIFSRAEIIPLETVDSSLIVWIKEVVPVGDKLYVHDDWALKLHVFDGNGKYKHKISRRGQAPNEYLNMQDCVIDTLNNDIYMLSIFGRVKRFSLDGTFKDEILLPSRPHYYSMELLGDKQMVTWSCLEKEEGGVLVLDRQTADTLGSYWHDDRMFDNQQYSPFFQNDGKVFFATALRQQVYEVSESGLLPAYQWDFGKYNIRESTLQYYLNIERPTDRNNKIIDDYGTEQLPFVLHIQRQNQKYCYVGLQRETGMRPAMTHVFYDKDKKKSLVFDFLDGVKCRMNAPLFWGDDYILTDVLYDNRESLKPILSKDEYQKLETMLEDDNPYLLKLYFSR